MSTASSGRVGSGPVVRAIAVDREPVPWLLVVLWTFAALALGFAMYFAVATGFGDVPSY